MLDRNGQTFAEVYEPANRRVPVKLSAVSPLLQGAFIATEDKRFREHKGVDERSIVRAFVANVAGGDTQGGSTITQQLAKNLLVGTENNYVRKMREMVIASRIETVMSKDAILELYLNAIYFGRGAWGVETAAQSYFGKDAGRGTDRGEAALLAGLAKGPSLLQPGPSSGSCARAHRLCAQPDARGRRHRRRAVRRGDGVSSRHSLRTRHEPADNRLSRRRPHPP